MAKAKQAGGLYYNSTTGDAYDANGNKLEGAAAMEKDTPPGKQPGAVGATPEERVGFAVARAIADPKGFKDEIESRSGKPKDAKEGEADESVKKPEGAPDIPRTPGGPPLAPPKEDGEEKGKGKDKDADKGKSKG